MPELPIIGTSYLLLIKIGSILLLLVYLAFAIILVKQVNLMTSTLMFGHEKVVRLLSKAHLVFSIAVLLFALFVL